jgi:hypothetical protein
MRDVTVHLTGTTHSGQVGDRFLQAVAGLSGMVQITLTGEIRPEVDLRLQDVAALSIPHLNALVARVGRTGAASQCCSQPGNPIFLISEECHK